VAWTILILVTAGFGVQQIMYVRAGAGGSWRATAAAAAVVLAIAALQLRHASAVLRGIRPRGWAWTLTAQALLVFVPYGLLGWEWATMGCLLTGAVLMVARGRWAWLLSGAVIAAQCAPALWASHGALFYLYTCAVSVQIGVIAYALDRLPRLAREVAAARERLARMAALHERLRISRDVHDLLGLGLSTITLKAELARRLAETEPARARAELAELVELADRSRAEARAVAEHDRPLSLREEAVSARAALRAAGAEVRMELPGAPLPAGVDGVLAAVLRESVTNVLRHARPRHCDISVTVRDGTARLAIANDGADDGAGEGAGRPAGPPPGPGAGKGLANLTVRTGAVGGTLSAGPDGPGRFVLVALVPVGAAARARPTSMVT
jgi:two-component system sensor histidine kinase DesK